ncbi:MAG: hypothetical protein JRJ02_02870 [Deltaproteobacteria bacterium]|nr:hypothetical protein [Deltaproteobacteria bacterium]
MAYVYLLDLYTYIDQRLAEAGKALGEAENENGDMGFHKGRIEALSDFRIFLKENFHSKLPRKIRESL